MDIESPEEMAESLLSGLRERETDEEKEEIDSYQIVVRGVPISVRIERRPGQATPFYILGYPDLPSMGPGTEAEIRSRLIQEFKPGSLKFTTVEEYRQVEERFESTTYSILEDLAPEMDAQQKKMMSVRLMMDMLGLGKIEPLIHDDNLEEVCVNASEIPVMVYHREHGWLTTNLILEEEQDIDDMAEKIASRFGKEITVADPVLDDAMLVTGDRVTATLYPISTKGNTITIRKFRRNPWTMVDFISPEIHTLSPELAALMWLCVQYELNVMIAGGTASGKTSLLNALLLFVPPEQRVVSIEDARELNLPDHLHWIPLTTREASGEKARRIDVLDLMLTAMRMRPDRVVLGEVRTSDEAQTLFEAAETGHSTYSTVHATRVEGMFRRLLNPPINVPKNMLASLHLALVQYRQRREGFRRTLEAAEVATEGEAFGDLRVKSNTLYEWDARRDQLDKTGESTRLVEELLFFSGMTKKEMDQDWEEKTKILEWMLDNDIRGIDEVGRIIQIYYHDKDYLVEAIRKGRTPEVV